jgi:hypothetical protein
LFNSFIEIFIFLFLQYCKSNSGPHTYKASTLPLCYIPSFTEILSYNLQFIHLTKWSFLNPSLSRLFPAYNLSTYFFWVRVSLCCPVQAGLKLMIILSQVLGLLVCATTPAAWLIFFFLSGTGVWNQGLHLQSRHCTAWVTPPIHFALVISEMGSLALSAWTGFKLQSSWP